MNFKEQRSLYKQRQKELNENKGELLLKVNSNSFKDFREQYGNIHTFWIIFLNIIMFIFAILILIYYLDSFDKELILLLFSLFMLGLFSYNLFCLVSLYKNKVLFYKNIFLYNTVSLVGGKLPSLLLNKKYFSCKEDVDEFRFDDDNLIIKINEKNQRFNQKETIEIKNLSQNEIEKIKSIRKIL